MILLQSDDETQEDKIILTLQPRLPVPSYDFPELPAGMLDSSGDFSGAASKEIQEETGKLLSPGCLNVWLISDWTIGLTINESELIDLTELAYGDRWRGMYPSAGGSGKKKKKKNAKQTDLQEGEALMDTKQLCWLDEFLRLFLCRKKMKQQDIVDLEGKLTGLRQEGESITLKVVPFKDAWRYSPDAKLLSSLALYDALSKSKQL